jgi:hypothetical protein
LFCESIIIPFKCAACTLRQKYKMLIFVEKT